MSLAGKLEDVPLADVMQFIHLGRRSGSLSLDHAGRHAQVSFQNGGIIGAWYPESMRLGELLLSKGILTQDALDSALALQAEEPTRRSLGQILIGDSIVDSDVLRESIKTQIEHTIYELVTWSDGSFTFELDAMDRPVDDVAVFPSELFPDLDINTQMVLLEAARIFDERQRDLDETTPRTPDSPAPRPTSTPAPSFSSPTPVPHDRGARAQEASDLFDETGELPPEVVPAEQVDALTEYEPGDEEKISARLELVTMATDDFAETIAERVAEIGGVVENVALSDVGGAFEDDVIVVFDVGEGITPADVASVVRSRPGLPVICILQDVLLAAAAYSAGAAAVVPRETEAIVGCFQNMARFRSIATGTGSSAANAVSKSAFAKLRRVVADLRSGVFSASVALNLMNVIAESVERAVLFLVKQDALVALGAFGFTETNESLAQRTKGLVLPLALDSALTRAIEARHPLDMDLEEADLPSELATLIGAPRNGQVVVFPVLGSDRVILVIYTDNGDLSELIKDIEILDLAASEVGIAFENELLRRQLSQQQGGSTGA